jgi:hypothetical protein
MSVDFVCAVAKCPIHLHSKRVAAKFFFLKELQELTGKAPAFGLGLF